MGLTERLGGRSVYLDSNVFIYAVEGMEPYQADLRNLFVQIASSKIIAVTSVLTLAEVLVKPFRD